MRFRVETGWVNYKYEDGPNKKRETLVPVSLANLEAGES